MIDQVLRGQDLAAAYLSNTIIHSSIWEDHIIHLCAVFESLRGAGITAKPQKCQFAMAQCVYLGQIVKNGVVRPERSKIEAVKFFPVPDTKKQVWCRRMVGPPGQLDPRSNHPAMQMDPILEGWTPRLYIYCLCMRRSLCIESERKSSQNAR